MLSSFAISIVLFALGAILGIYLPLALAYLVNKFRRTHFGMQMIWKVTFRLAAALFLYFVLFGVCGFLFEALLKEQPESTFMWLGFGFMTGLAAGILLFFIGLLKGRADAG